MRVFGLEREAAACGRRLGRRDFGCGVEEEMGGEGFGQQGVERDECGKEGDGEEVWSGDLERNLGNTLPRSEGCATHP